MLKDSNLGKLSSRYSGNKFAALKGRSTRNYKSQISADSQFDQRLLPCDSNVIDRVSYAAIGALFLLPLLLFLFSR